MRTDRAGTGGGVETVVDALAPAGVRAENGREGEPPASPCVTGSDGPTGPGPGPGRAAVGPAWRVGELGSQPATYRRQARAAHPMHGARRPAPAEPRSRTQRPTRAGRGPEARHALVSGPISGEVPGRMAPGRPAGSRRSRTWSAGRPKGQGRPPRHHGGSTKPSGHRSGPRAMTTVTAWPTVCLKGGRRIAGSVRRPRGA